MINFIVRPTSKRSSMNIEKKKIRSMSINILTYKTICNHENEMKVRPDGPDGYNIYRLSIHYVSYRNLQRTDKVIIRLI